LNTIAGVCSELPPEALLVGCVDVQDPTNLGGILRNCAAFGVHAVLVSKHCADPFARRVLRVSMGASLQLWIIECDDITAELQQLGSDHNFQTVATVVGAAPSLEDAARAERMVLVIGSEAEGLPDDLIDACDRRVTIPMSPQTDSLNASVAAGVFLYHFTRVARIEP
jgi:tRNA G18 (ribose-2'-O)-methylase SpoU